MTLGEMSSLIRSNISNGLIGIGDYQYAREAIEAETGSTRNLLMQRMSTAGKLFNPEHFSQKEENIKLDMVSFPVGGFSAHSKVPHCKIWKVAMLPNNESIIQLGPPDMSFNFKVYYDIDSLSSHRYSRIIKGRPYAFVDLANDIDGFNDVYLFNSPPNLDYISERSIKNDPVKMLQEMTPFGGDAEFPSPSSVQDQIVNTITEKYIRYYRQLNEGTKPDTNTNEI